METDPPTPILRTYRIRAMERDLTSALWIKKDARWGGSIGRFARRGEQGRGPVSLQVSIRRRELRYIMVVVRTTGG